VDINYEKYKNISREMLDVVIYVEGNNIIFYKKLKELERYFIDTDNKNSLPNGNCCSEIRRQVREDRKQGKKSYAILDRDYNDLNSFDNFIFPIDYYSLENVSLLFMEEFKPLENKIIDYVQEDFENRRFENLKLIIKRYDDKRVRDFEIDNNGKVHSDIENYISNVINSNNYLLRYKDLKMLITSFVSYNKQKNGKEANIKYFDDLPERLPEKSIKYLFDDKTYSEVMRELY